jgi:hypothetical protein
MKRSSALIVALLFVSGCQTAQLQHATVQQSGSVTDLYYQQVINNIAMLHENPTRLPYFSQPQTGQTTAQYSLSVAATPEWDLVTTATRLLGVVAFAKQSGTVSGSDTNIEMWNTAPTLVPNKIILMKYAYEVAFGDQTHLGQLVKVLDAEYKYYKAIDGREDEKFKQIDEARKTLEDTNKQYTDATTAREKASAHYDAVEKAHNEGKATLKEKQKAFKTREEADSKVAVLQDKKKLDDDRLKEKLNLMGPPEFSLTHFAMPYTSMLHSGWYEVGRRHQVPKNARYVGHYGKLYAWVRPGDEERFSEFTLVILNIATFEAPDREKRASPSANAGKVAR